MIPPPVRQYIHAHFHIKLAALLANEIKRRLLCSLGMQQTFSAEKHKSLQVKESIAYIEEVFDDYKKYLKNPEFHGRVAEVGPGNNAGVALLILKAGCQKIDLVDRFPPKRDVKKHALIYQQLSNNHDLERFRQGTDWDDEHIRGLAWHCGQASEIYFEECAKHRQPKYDFIVSRAVFEHLYNPLDALRDGVRCLNPGGKIAHKVDLRDHGAFSRQLPELSFLRIPSCVWNFFAREVGRPNRILTHHYRNLLEKLRKTDLSDFSILVTRLVGVGEINPHRKFEDIDPGLRQKALQYVEKYRQGFCKPFRNLDAEDLAVSGIFITAQKRR